MAPGLRPRRRDRDLLGNLKTRTFAELLIDCEEDRTLREVLVGMLRDVERSGRPRNPISEGTRRRRIGVGVPQVRR